MADPLDRHTDHDPELIASLLDRDPDAAERAAAEARLASCAECAALHADLLALTTATAALPFPPRTRDFRLTAADAARLAAPVTGEPAAAPARLMGVKTDPRVSNPHASHDTMLVASLVDHSLAASERHAAEALIASCEDCAALHLDLTALRAATRALPMPT